MRVIFSLNFDVSLCFGTSHLNCKMRFLRPYSQIIQVQLKNTYSFQIQSSFKQKFNFYVLNKRKERYLTCFCCLHCFLEKLLSKIEIKQGLYPAKESRYVQCQYRNHGDSAHKDFCRNPFKMLTPLNLKGLEFSVFSLQNSEPNASPLPQMQILPQTSKDFGVSPNITDGG